MEENQKYSFLPHVLDLIHLFEQNFCPDSKFRVKTMYESVKFDMLNKQVPSLNYSYDSTVFH